MIRAALYLREDNRLCVHVRRMGWFFASEIFSPNADLARAGAFEQGEALARALPKGFLRLINTYGADKTLMMDIVSPGLNNFLWEYVPVYRSGESPGTWQSLPFIRAVPGSKYRVKPSENNIKDLCFLSDNTLLQTHKYPALDDEITREVKTKACNPNGGDVSRWAGNIKEYLNTADFLHIVTHGEVGFFRKGGQGAYFLPENIDGSKGIPRIVLAECCHSAEAGPKVTTWETTMPGQFMIEGAAVYIGNLGKVIIPEDGTYFSACFLSEFLTTPYKTFAEAVRETRRRAARSAQYDPNCVHVVYAAANLHPDRNRCADIINAPILKKSGYHRLPRCPRAPLPWREKWPAWALGVLALTQAAFFYAQTSLHFTPFPAMTILAAAATAVFAYYLCDRLLLPLLKKNRSS